MRPECSAPILQGMTSILRDAAKWPLLRMRARRHFRLAVRNISVLAKVTLTGHKNCEKKSSAENDLTIKGKAYIAGIYEHPTRHAPDKSTAQLHAEVAKGALEDAGLTRADIDGYFCAGDAPGGVMAMVDYLGLKVRHFDSTETGGCSYLVHSATPRRRLPPANVPSR